MNNTVTSVAAHLFLPKKEVDICSLESQLGRAPPAMLASQVVTPSPAALLPIELPTKAPGKAVAVS